MSTTSATPAPQPWWRFGHVWLVLSGPAVVVVAGFVTLYIALSGADPVVDENYYQKGLEINRTLGAQAAESLAPAMQARNHAATGLRPVPPSTKP
ncbi:FixH family protein [uncultured Rhodoferax sp.]|uniref:FixH family protein n=1 Tax=uncultured Rhodoferax sp. TaxID=223188 RepID=UPI0025DF124F|nr:FixH family protein [uncultured Rhodoferax sp.]